MKTIKFIYKINKRNLRLDFIFKMKIEPVIYEIHVFYLIIIILLIHTKKSS